MRKKSRLLRFTNNFEVKEKIILRDHLALERTKLANERTLLTYIRSSIYLIIAGIAFLNVKEFEHIPYLAYLCFFFSGLLFFIGIIRFYQLKRHIKVMYEEGLFPEE
ncbi:putative membrane protein [Balneicella halophila]|uniref:Putative membrane protein n=1 Tax=Balneicella halophila TaxID=1537566 RepID=A0A7L4UNE1_BALHA|nr:DUF202 domain-containing protein [Balneicella halophila]PVX50703.1 putative membrane protein [Balneicella halophila]